MNEQLYYCTLRVWGNPARYCYFFAFGSCNKVAISYIILNFLLCTVPSASPRNVIATAVSSTSIMVTWDDPLEADQNGIIISYIVRYTNLNRSEDEQFNSSTSERQLTLLDLQEYEEYNISIAAETVVGVGPFSDPSSIFTFEDSECIYLNETLAS